MSQAANAPDPAPSRVYEEATFGESQTVDELGRGHTHTPTPISAQRALDALHCEGCPHLICGCHSFSFLKVYVSLL